MPFLTREEFDLFVPGLGTTLFPSSPGDPAFVLAESTAAVTASQISGVAIPVSDASIAPVIVKRAVADLIVWDVLGANPTFVTQDIRLYWKQKAESARLNLAEVAKLRDLSSPELYARVGPVAGVPTW
ncbi:MAG: hypothetical protein LCH53_13635 [Bacteroidetes bacterium]|nr:hypothetical protein [Bacteroidota bacterium]